MWARGVRWMAAGREPGSDFNRRLDKGVYIKLETLGVRHFQLERKKKTCNLYTLSFGLAAALLVEKSCGCSLKTRGSSLVE